MDRIRSSARVRLLLENDKLTMYGSASESAGCVLRGVLEVAVQEPIKVKAINLRFSGKMIITWTEPVGNGHERLFHDDRSIINHNWEFLPKSHRLHCLEQGNYRYEFELPLPGDLPESTQVASFYIVQYRLKATVERARFLPNIISRRTIHISRQILPLTDEYMEPVTIANHWANKFDYEISIPTKVYCLGDQIPVSIRVTPLAPDIKIRHLSCTFKEYMVCRASSGWFGGHSRSQGRIIHFSRDATLGKTNSSPDDSFVVWEKDMAIPVPNSNDLIQCNVLNDAVRIRHKLKFVMSIENPDGHVSELRAALPIHICSINNTTGLPSYEETWRTIPYDPAIMVALLSNRSDIASSSSAATAPAATTTTTGEQQLQQRRRHRPWFSPGATDDEDEEKITCGESSTVPLPSYSSIFSCGNTDIESSVHLSGLPTYDELLCISR